MLSLTGTSVMYLFLLLGITLVIDWVSGTIVAYLRNEQSSKIGINGILKKCLIFFIAIILVASEIAIPQIEFFTIIMLFALSAMQIQSVYENLLKVNLREAIVLKKLIEYFDKIPKEKEEESKDKKE